MALLRAAAGQVDEALDALRPTLGLSPFAEQPRLPHLQRLLAVVELADQVGDVETLATAAREAAELSEARPGEVTDALAQVIRGRAAIALGDTTAGVALLRDAVAVLIDVGLPYEAACGRLLLARAATVLGDELTSSMEASSAAATLDRLGAVTVPEAEVRSPRKAGERGPLSGREVEVLELVAEGLTIPVLERSRNG